MLIETKDKISKLIQFDEGFVGKMYEDIKGNNTIGFGFNLDKIEMPYQIAVHWIDLIIDQISYSLINSTINGSFFNHLNDARRYVIINMVYQMGFAGFMKFTKLIDALKNGDFDSAVKEMINSKWHNEFKDRSNRLIKIMQIGEF